jgi:hypothetical protein
MCDMFVGPQLTTMTTSHGKLSIGHAALFNTHQCATSHLPINYCPMSKTLRELRKSLTNQTVTHYSGSRR